MYQFVYWTHAHLITIILTETRVNQHRYFTPIFVIIDITIGAALQYAPNSVQARRDENKNIISSVRVFIQLCLRPPATDIGHDVTSLPPILCQGLD